MELGKAETVGMLDDHHGCVGNVHANFDYRGGDEDLDFVAAELLHYGVFLVVLQAAVKQTNAQFGEYILGQAFELGGGGF